MLGRLVRGMVLFILAVTIVAWAFSAKEKAPEPQAVPMGEERLYS